MLGWTLTVNRPADGCTGLRARACPRSVPADHTPCVHWVQRATRRLPALSSAQCQRQCWGPGGLGSGWSGARVGHSRRLRLPSPGLPASTPPCPLGRGEAPPGHLTVKGPRNRNTGLGQGAQRDRLLWRLHTAPRRTHSHRVSPALRGPPVETGLEGAIGDKLVLLAQDRWTSVRQLKTDTHATAACSRAMERGRRCCERAAGWL